MTTQARIHANRLNAQKSTGPRTPQGKAVVSQNALKHGLADRIVSLSWRLKRADLIQNQTIDAMHEANESNPLTNLAKSFGLNVPIPSPSQLKTQNQKLKTPFLPDLTLGRIALKDFSNGRVLDRLLMYERRIENSLHKTILELQRLNLLRNLDPPIPYSQQDLAPGFTGGSPKKSPENQPSPTPPFSHRRHDDVESIENPQSRTHRTEQTKSHPPKTPAPRGTYDIQHPTYDIKNTKYKPNLLFER